MDVLNARKGLCCMGRAGAAYAAVVLPKLQGRDVALDMRPDTALGRIPERAVDLGSQRGHVILNLSYASLKCAW